MKFMNALHGKLNSSSIYPSQNLMKYDDHAPKILECMLKLLDCFKHSKFSNYPLVTLHLPSVNDKW